MKRTIVILMAVLLCLSLAVPVFAAENDFVPSITYKGSPEIVKGEQDSEDVTDCLEVTSIIEAKNKKTDITQEERDLLLEVYEKLSDGSMKLPLEEDMTIMELVDVSYAANRCVGTGHDHKEELAKEGTTVEITFKLDVDNKAEVTVLAYVNGQWTEIESVTANGDGTFTCVFEDICPVAFCVDGDVLEKIPATGDTGNVFLWLAIMLASAVALVATLVIYRRRVAK